MPTPTCPKSSCTADPPEAARRTAAHRTRTTSLTGTVCCSRRRGKHISMVMRGRVWCGLMSLGDPYSPSQYSSPSSPSGEPESKRREAASSSIQRRSSSPRQDGLASGGLSRATSIRIPSSSIDEFPDFTSWNAQDDWMTDLWSTQNLN